MIKKINRLRNTITELDQKIINVQKESHALIEMLRAWDEGEQVTYETLKNLALYEPLEIGENVISYRIPAQDGTLSFVVLMQQNSKLPGHFHDCRELCIKLFGDLIVNGRKMVNKEIVFEIDESHELKSAQLTLLIVHFEEPN